MDKDYSVINRVFILLNILMIGILLGSMEEKPLPPIPIEPPGETVQEILYKIGEDWVVGVITLDTIEGVSIAPPPIYIPQPPPPPLPPPPLPPRPPKPPTPIVPVIYAGSNREKRVAITFDDGPNATTLSPLLEILDQYDVKATFFLIGQRAQGREDLVKKIYDRGHQIANHSYSHPYFTKLSRDRGEQEITKTERILGDYMTYRYFRPPYGDYNRQTLELAYKLEYRIILWDVDTRDWMATSSEEIVRRVKEKTKAGSIILFHEGKELTLKALPEILEWLTEEGYTFVTVAELLGD
ncbi:polysaccharide deacetylase family protein [Anaerobranca gottschalkii]|uniref:Polysaccharide deacetylase family sporulation protein PdaB n=1 Tax=Anaerobranca gottschalkii DSM 13577 TaxID=1120990 RepID=A0A1H9ZIN9_9FIRM|nr:polysaccharide deacetylase family protein [Anaerobranca gottschalkii]SES81193.1 polysaccharide deacetylase family sporulation protein PdaB [Anaerobranca gottschalkii DSM 13577]